MLEEVLQTLRHVFSDGAGEVRKKVIGLYVFLAILNVGAWVWALSEFQGHPVLLGASVLAYSFGLRHAFDADHIASIDGVTRKLMHEGKRPLTVGFHFSVGHSLAVMVFVVSIAVVTSANMPGGSFNFFNTTMGVVSTGVSVTFLLLMAGLNLTIAKSTYQAFQRIRTGGDYVEEDFDLLMNKRGFFARIFRPLFGFVAKSWHMVFIGLLFGLGFDTATEVSLLGIAGAEAVRGLSVSAVLAFPCLFAAAMALMDTTDSILMVGAYGWAFRRPVRKLYYNLTITVVSALVALLIAGAEAVSALCAHVDIKFPGVKALGALSEHWGATGVFVVSVFLLSWIVSAVVYHAKGYDHTGAGMSISAQGAAEGRPAVAVREAR